MELKSTIMNMINSWKSISQKKYLDYVMRHQRELTCHKYELLDARNTVNTGLYPYKGSSLNKDSSVISVSLLSVMVHRRSSTRYSALKMFHRWAICQQTCRTDSDWVGIPVCIQHAFTGSATPVPGAGLVEHHGIQLQSYGPPLLAGDARPYANGWI